MNNDKTLTILFVIDNLGSGGAQRQITTLAIGLKRRGFNVYFFTYYPQDFFKNRLDLENIKVFFHPKVGKIGFNVIYSLWKVHKEIKPDFTITFLDGPNFYGACCKLILNKKMKLIVSERFCTNFEKLTMRDRSQIFSHKISDWVVTNSIHEKETWKKQFPRLDSKTSCIYNGLDLDKFKVKESFHFTNNLLCIGRVGPSKNGLFIIEILNLLKNKFKKNISLTWIGAKHDYIKEWKEYYEEMNNRIEQFQLEKDWKWIESTDDIVSYLQSSDAFLHAALKEGVPNVVCEAMACGVPVFLSNVLDHPHLVEDNVNGFLIPVDNPKVAAKKIADFYNMHENEIIRISRKARDFAINNFPIEKMLSSYVSLLNNFEKK